MGITVGLILITLVILVLAFKGIFGVFPDNWEWVATVLAGVGLAMAVPNVIQMIIGHPQLLIEFDRIVQKQERALVIFLKNPPIRNKVWRKLGIRRDTIQSLMASFRILEVGSNRVILPICHARIYSDDDPSDTGRNRVVLPPTYSVAASIMIAQWDETKSRAIIPGDRLRQPLGLSPGYYQVSISFTVDGELRKRSMKFVVGTEADALIWARPTPDKEGS